MVANTLANGPIGTHHGEMQKRVRNPFRDQFMRKSYDAAVQTYDTKHRNFIYPWGTRCIGNAWATNFWRGYDGMQRNWDKASKESPAYAMWCAGRDIRKAVDGLTSRQK